MGKHSWIVAALCFWIAPALARGQESPAVQNLVAEVHQLRIAVERMGSIVPRMQITLQRLQLQEQRVTELSRQLMELRARLSAVTADQAREIPRLQELADRIRDAQDPTRRSLFQEQHDQAKSNLQRVTGMVQQLSTQEAELASLLRTEHSKLDELTEKLTTLERALEIK